MCSMEIPTLHARNFISGNKVFKVGGGRDGARLGSQSEQHLARIRHNARFSLPKRKHTNLFQLAKRISDALG